MSARPLSRHAGCGLGPAALTLAVCLTAATVFYQQPSGAPCDGRLGAGFPAAFVCDASGESPLSSVGRIDWADADSANFLGLSADVLFYLAILTLAGLSLSRLARRAGSNPTPPIP